VNTAACADHSGLYLAFLGPNLTIQRANNEFLRRFGGPTVYGRSFCDLAHPSIRRPLLQQFTRLLRGGQHHFATQVVTVKPEGKAFTGALTAVAVHGGTAEADAIMVMMRAPKGEEQTEAMTDREILTKVDARILEGIAEGMSTAPLAERVYLSRQGVEYHVTRLLRMHRVSNRAALVARAYSMGVLHAGTWPPKVDPQLVE
jgi:DNA-binding CsgD family transcriptional regulator